MAAHSGYTALGCVIRTDGAAPSALLTLAQMSTLRTKPVTLNHAHLRPPICHLHIRRYVLVLTYIFICFYQVDALKKFPHQISVCIIFLPGIIYMPSLSQTAVALTNIG
jgi:hypothetical protein